MFPLIAGAIAGAAYGIVVGYIKYAAIWKKTLKSDNKISMGVLYRHLGLSYAVNILTLLFVFLMRNHIPWNFAAVLIGTAVMLSLAGKLAPMNEIMSHVEEKA